MDKANGLMELGGGLPSDDIGILLMLVGMLVAAIGIYGVVYGIRLIRK